MMALANIVSGRIGAKKQLLAIKKQMGIKLHLLEYKFEKTKGTLSMFGYK